MISDVLSGAIHDINSYRNNPAYRELFLEIYTVVAFMDALRSALDLAPGPFGDPRYRQMLDAIRQGKGVADRLEELQRAFEDDAARERAVNRFEDEPPQGRPS